MDLELKRDIVKELADRNRLTVARTPAAGCPACRHQRVHRTAEEKAFHPLMGHGTPDGKTYSYARAEVVGAR
jgi:hypothetical protein